LFTSRYSWNTEKLALNIKQSITKNVKTRNWMTRTPRTPLKQCGEVMCFGRVGSSFSNKFALVIIRKQFHIVALPLGFPREHVRFVITPICVVGGSWLICYLCLFTTRYAYHMTFMSFKCSTALPLIVWSSS
jgi:hypothetical protein